MRPPPVSMWPVGGAEGPGDGEEGTCQGREGSDGEIDFSYLWASNSAETTVSRINTRTLDEEGRYYTSPNLSNFGIGGGDPSRTSVGLSGDVVVANRAGGLTKIYAREDDCVDSNGVAGIQTSTGAEDVLAWGEDECIAWHSDLGYVTQRPVAWTAGEFNPVTCRWDNEMVWTTGNFDEGGARRVTAHRLRGDDGSVDAMVELPGVQVYALGPYGGAADGDGNFWFFQSNALPAEDYTLFRIDAETLAVEHWPLPEGRHGYGITVDSEGRPWIAGGGVMRFDRDALRWDISSANYSGHGLMQGGDGKMWVQAFRQEDDVRVASFDLETLDVVDAFEVDRGGKGISVDFDGYVWNVGGKFAVRIDPDDGSYEYYDGLFEAYTYSDMTGWGLRSAAGLTPPQG